MRDHPWLKTLTGSSISAAGMSSSGRTLFLSRAKTAPQRLMSRNQGTISRSITSSMQSMSRNSLEATPRILERPSAHLSALAFAKSDSRSGNPGLTTASCSQTMRLIQWFTDVTTSLELPSNSTGYGLSLVSRLQSAVLLTMPSKTPSTT